MSCHGTGSTNQRLRLLLVGLTKDFCSFFFISHQFGLLPTSSYRFEGELLKLGTMETER